MELIITPAPGCPKQSVGDEMGQFVTYCLGVPLILRGILEHFSTETLLKVSLVNKQWNYEARCVLRDRGRLTARTHLPSCERENLENFASSLRSMKVVPFSGMSIYLSRGCAKGGTTEGKLPPIYNDILDQLPWKHLTVSLMTRWESHKHCPAFLLVKKILKNYGCVLEEFSLNLQCKERQLVEEALEDCSFPQLKTLKIYDHWGHPEEKVKLIKMLVSRSTTLQVLYTHGPVDLKANLLEGRSAVHVTDYPYYFSSVPESVVGELRLEKMGFIGFEERYSLNTFTSITSTLLQNSRALLNTVRIDVIFLMALTYFGIRLDNVQKLTLSVTRNLELVRPETLRIVRNFDFTRMFPRVKQIGSIVCPQPSDVHWDPMDEMFEQQNANEPSPDRAANIKSVRLHCYSALEEYTIQFLAEMFPHIEELELQYYTDYTPIPYTRLWEQNWVELKELKILSTDSGVGDGLNFDSVFCGIFPEEVVQLRGQNEEYLQSVNIVPVMPSITCWKGLRTLQLFYNRWPQPQFIGPVDDPTNLLFSKVTGLLAFRRCPGLAVTLGTRDEEFEQELRHLKAYASVVRYDYFPLSNI